MKLNIGCGQHLAPEPWVNVDSQPDVEPDVVASICALPYGSGTVEAIYCGHVLEHLTYDTELPAALREIRRVLAPDGVLCIVGPDYDRAAANEEWVPLLSLIRDGGGRWVGDEHQWVSTGPRTLEAVLGVFPGATEVDIATVGEFWPVVDHVGWQFAIFTEARMGEPDEEPEDPREERENPRQLEHAVPFKKETR